jgi:hypothetical protein
MLDGKILEGHAPPWPLSIAFGNVFAALSKATPLPWPNTGRAGARPYHVLTPDARSASLLWPNTRTRGSASLPCPHQLFIENPGIDR